MLLKKKIWIFKWLKLWILNDNKEVIMEYLNYGNDKWNIIMNEIVIIIKINNKILVIINYKEILIIIIKEMLLWIKLKIM